MPLPCHFCLKFDDKNKRCGKCKTVFYCSRNCQAKDWKHGSEKYGLRFPRHEIMCEEISNDDLAFRAPEDINGDISKYFPGTDEDTLFQWSQFHQLATRRASALNDPEVGCTFDEDQPWSLGWLLPFRVPFQEKVEAKKVMINALAFHNEKKIGHVFPDREYGSGLISNGHNFQQSLRVYPALKLNLFGGETFVAVGFVDLTQLLISNFVERGEEPIKYVGIEMDYAKITRCNIILEMMKDITCDDRSILQVMYSLKINELAYDFLKRATEKHLDKECALGLRSPSQIACIKKMMKRSRSSDKQKLFTQFLFEEMSGINLLKSRVQRMKFFQFCSTRTLFCDDSCKLLKNPTMTYQTSEEDFIVSFFRMFDLSWFESAETEEDFFNAIESYFLRNIRKLRLMILEGKVECTLVHKKVGELDSMKEDATFIRKFNPSVIDWSSLIDYFHPMEFMEWICTCGAPNTVHLTYSVEWNIWVLGYLSKPFMKNRDDKKKTFEASRRQFHQDWNRVLQERPYLTKVFHQDGMLFQTQPLIQTIWANYIKFYFLNYIDDVGRKKGGMRVIRTCNTDKWHAPANFFNWAFDMALVSEAVPSGERKNLVNKYAPMYSKQ